MRSCLVLMIYLGLATLHASASDQERPSQLLNAGKYAVGFQLLVREDKSRTFTTAASIVGSRPVRMFMWYPARTSRQKLAITFRSYVESEGRGLADAAPRLSETVGTTLSETQLQAIFDSPTKAFVDTVAVKGRFPLVLLGGGLNGTAYYHTLLAEHLASYGYVVVALSSMPEREGGRLAFDKAGLGLLVGDLQFALGELKKDPRVDINRLGLAGWSVGGVALAAVAEKDLRVDALVSLDSGLSYNYGLPLLNEYLSERKARSIPLLDLRGLAANRFAVPRDSKYFDAALGKVLRVNFAALNHVQCTSLAILVSSVTGFGHKTESLADFRSLVSHTKAFLELNVRRSPQRPNYLNSNQSGRHFSEQTYLPSSAPVLRN